MEIKYSEEKSASGKISCKSCPLSLGDGIANKLCFGFPSPRPHGCVWEFSNSPRGTVLYSLQVPRILSYLSLSYQLPSLGTGN